MTKSILSKYSVKLLHSEINAIAKIYLGSEQIGSVEKYMHKDEYDKGYLVYWLWYYFVIFHLSNNEEFAYIRLEDGEITLDDFNKDKVLILQQTTKEILFQEFNQFINVCNVLKKYRKKMYLESSLQSIANNGLLSLINMYNYEKTSIIENYFEFEKDLSGKKEKLISEIAKLDFTMETAFIPRLKYDKIYQKIAQLRKENSKVTDNIRVVVKEFKGKHIDLDNLFKMKNDDLKDVVEHLRRLFYDSKYSKL